MGLRDIASHQDTTIDMRRTIVWCIVVNAWLCVATTEAARIGHAHLPTAGEQTHPIAFHVEYQQIDAGVNKAEVETYLTAALTYLASVVHVHGPAPAPLLLPRPCAVTQTWSDGRQECIQEVPLSSCLQAFHNASFFDQTRICSGRRPGDCRIEGSHNPPLAADVVLYVTATAGGENGMVHCGRQDAALASSMSGPSGSLAAAGGACAVDSATNRPIAGAVNICPERLMMLRTASTFSRDSLVMDCVHELLHVLAFSEALYGSFRDRNGITSVDGRLLVRSSAVVAVAKAHFNCPSLIGVPLEDDGGDGTANTHWEMRTLNGELMVGTVLAGQRPSLSNFTLAFLEDTGWYAPRYSLASPLAWGRGAGCGFVTASSCHSTPNQFFCSPTAVGAQCTFDSLAVGTCIQLPLTKEQEQCFVVAPYSNWVCRDSSLADADRALWGNSFGAGSRCVAGGEQPWSRSQGRLVYTQDEPTAGCFLTSCTGGGAAQVSIAGESRACPGGANISVPMFKGTLGPCPSDLCVSLACKNDCNANGDCSAGLCVCWPGWTGADCSQAA